MIDGSMPRCVEKLTDTSEFITKKFFMLFFTADDAVNSSDKFQ
ncbi:hypothetical protein T03_12892 [Trichinella britovi]|uniref:Uncharacterized protein n=1 Tax=Trichinella britovi TaxID=45882 RepID=A0A0V1D4S4_TRIBR|nr:hypothetical protein T09_11368 [Trichinella sp. T9]KRY56540.1 hypothetical protein T03_12892 [Trichinella britovi]